MKWQAPETETQQILLEKKFQDWDVYETKFINKLFYMLETICKVCYSCFLLTNKVVIGDFDIADIENYFLNSGKNC